MPDVPKGDAFPACDDCVRALVNSEDRCDEAPGLPNGLFRGPKSLWAKQSPADATNNTVSAIAGTRIDKLQYAITRAPPLHASILFAPQYGKHVTFDVQQHAGSSSFMILHFGRIAA